jgi:hypothetical protein
MILVQASKLFEELKKGTSSIEINNVLMLLSKKL